MDWNAIKSALIEYFGDKSDLSTLVFRLTAMKQGWQLVLEFYLAKINANVLMSNNTPKEVTENMRSSIVFITRLI